MAGRVEEREKDTKDEKRNRMKREWEVNQNTDEKQATQQQKGKNKQ
jgi:hypothetical protein